jgi:hypothetical protein
MIGDVHRHRLVEHAQVGQAIENLDYQLVQGIRFEMETLVCLLSLRRIITPYDVDVATRCPSLAIPIEMHSRSSTEIRDLRHESFESRRVDPWVLAYLR